MRGLEREVIDALWLAVEHGVLMGGHRTATERRGVGHDASSSTRWVGRRRVFDAVATECIEAFDRIARPDLSELGFDGSQHTRPLVASGHGPNPHRSGPRQAGTGRWPSTETAHHWHARPTVPTATTASWSNAPGDAGRPWPASRRRDRPPRPQLRRRLRTRSAHPTGTADTVNRPATTRLHRPTPTRVRLGWRPAITVATGVRARSDAASGHTGTSASVALGRSVARASPTTTQFTCNGLSPYRKPPIVLLSACQRPKESRAGGQRVPGRGQHAAWRTARVHGPR